MKKSVWIKILSSVLAAVVALTLAACSGGGINNGNIPTSSVNNSNSTNSPIASPDVEPDENRASQSQTANTTSVVKANFKLTGGFIAPIVAPDPNAIEIYNAQNLHDVRNNMYGSYVLMNDIDLSGFNEGEWVPIGDEDNQFYGTFDGQGHVIQNLKITGDSYEYAGLFGCVSDGTLMNIGLSNSYIDVQRSSGTVYVGAIAGYVSSSSALIIDNCYNTGYISSSSSSFAGGIAGVAATSSSLTISNCYNTGDILASASVGGIVGNAAAGGMSSSIFTIMNCYNTGDISGSAASHDSYAGGIVGKISESSSSISSSIFTIDSCYNTGNVSDYSQANTSHASGIAGYVYSSSTFTISNCYNTGNAFASTDNQKSYVGGIVGRASSSPLAIDNCYNTGDVSASAASYSYAGGLTGRTSSVTMANCYNIGDASAESLAAHTAYAGGIAGEASTMTLLNCYNTGDAYASPAVGGILGSALGSVLGSNASLTLENCYYIDSISSPVGTSATAVSLNNVRALTGTQMTQQSSYDGFNFSAIWDIGPGVNGGFPYLRELAT
jgi:hypothetical protein